MNNNIFKIVNNLYPNMNNKLIGNYAIRVDGAGMFSKCFGYIVMDFNSTDPLNYEEIIILTDSGERQVRQDLELTYSLRTISKLNAINELKEFYKNIFTNQ